MIDRYNDLQKQSVIDGSWFTYYDVSESDCINKAAWKERATKYAPIGGDGEWRQGDRVSLFALAHIHKWNIILHNPYDANPEKIKPIFGRLHAAGAGFNRHVEGNVLCKGGLAGFHDLKKTTADHEAPAVRP